MAQHPKQRYIIIGLCKHYNVAVSFIGGGNQSTMRKPPTCHKSLTNFLHKQEIVTNG